MYECMNVCLHKVFQSECLVCLVGMFPLLPQKKQTNQLSFLQNNNSVVYICVAEVAGVNERQGQQRGKVGDTAEGAQSSESTVFVYAP